MFRLLVGLTFAVALGFLAAFSFNRHDPTPANAALTVVLGIILAGFFLSVVLYYPG